MNPLDLKLYQLFSDKTLSQGCMLMSHVLQVPVMYLYSAVSHHVCWHNRSLGSEEFDTTVILWHPPELHDVFRVAKEKGITIAVFWYYPEPWEQKDSGLVLNNGTQKDVPYNPTLPLLSQSDETNHAIISLFESHQDWDSEEIIRLISKI